MAGAVDVDVDVEREDEAVLEAGQLEQQVGRIGRDDVVLAAEDDRRDRDLDIERALVARLEPGRAQVERVRRPGQSPVTSPKRGPVRSWEDDASCSRPRRTAPRNLERFDSSVARIWSA